MYLRIISACCFALISATITGCIGLFVVYPVECLNETPRPDIYSSFKVAKPTPLTPSFMMPDPRTSFTKADFLKEWGNPDFVLFRGPGRETWIYKQTLWCGAIPVFILPVPLLLPLCDGYYLLEFEGDAPTALQTRHGGGGGFVIPAGGAGGIPACSHSAGTDHPHQAP